MDFDTFLESKDEVPQHLIDEHRKEAAKRGMTLKHVSHDEIGIVSKTNKGRIFTTDYDAKTGKYSHEESPAN